MPVEFESVVTVSAAKQIADSLRAAIMDGRLKMDERLPTEEELAQRFKVREREAIVEFHARLLKARDAEAATAALGDLVSYTHDRYREALERRAERAGQHRETTFSRSPAGAAPDGRAMPPPPRRRCRGRRCRNGDKGRRGCRSGRNAPPPAPSCGD